MKTFRPHRWLLLCAIFSFATYAAIKPDFWQPLWGDEVSSQVLRDSDTSPAKSGGKPIQQTRVQSPNGSTLTVTPILAVNPPGFNPPGENCTLAGYNALGEPTLVAPHNDDLCKVQVSWSLAPADRVEGISLIESRNMHAFDRGVDSRGGLPDSGQITTMLSPTGITAKSDISFALRLKSMFGAPTLSTRVYVYDHAEASSELPVAPGSCLALGDVANGADDPLTAVNPGRWKGFKAENPNFPANLVPAFPGTSYDFEIRNYGPVGSLSERQIRVTWYTYDGNFRPVWLQTEWLNLVSYNPGSKFSGELRRYRWNAANSGRTGGKRVGRITGFLVKPDGTTGGNDFRISVMREWDEQGVTNMLPDGKLVESECLMSSGSLGEYGRNATVNPAYSGVWHLRDDAPNSEADSMVIDAATGTESHLFRLWDTAGNPVWVYANKQHGTAPTQFIPNEASLPVRYARSPYVGGFPGAVCRLNRCEMCTIPLGNIDETQNGLVRSYNSSIDQYGNDPFNRALVRLGLNAAGNLPAQNNPAFGPFSQCTLYNSDNPSGMNNLPLNWVRHRAVDLLQVDKVQRTGRDNFSFFVLDQDSSSNVGRVSASPEVNNKTAVNTESSFTVSWAMTDIPMGGRNIRLVRRQVGSNQVRVVRNGLQPTGSLVDNIYEISAPEIRAFPAGSYTHELQVVDAEYPSGITLAKGAPVYVRGPNQPPEAPNCLRIVPGTLAGMSVSCPTDTPSQVLNASPNAPLVAMFSHSSAAESYFVTEEKIVNGALVAANCNTPTQLSIGAQISGPPPAYGIQINACADPGRYLYQVYLCNPTAGCSNRRPIVPWEVIVGETPADTYEVDDSPSTSSPPLAVGATQNRNFHLPNDVDWAIVNLAAGERAAIEVKPVTNMSVNRWRAELYSSPVGSVVRTTEGNSIFGSVPGFAAFNVQAPSTAGRWFWVRVSPLDSSFFGGNTAYTIAAKAVNFSVTLTSPVNNATYNAPATIPLAATVAGAGSVQRVEFYRGTTRVCTVTTSPYSCSDTNVGQGTHSYTAKAFDTGTPQLSATSSVATVVVGTVTNTVLPAAQSPASAELPTASEIAESSRVGSLDGSLRVSESGAVNFSVEFLTAPGRGGVVPKLGLGYGGDTRLGVAGIGFNITGLSSIARCRKTQESGDGVGPHPQINFDTDSSNDAFCLDGQRLLPTGFSGNLVIDGINYPYLDYRTEIEGFQRIRAFLSTPDAQASQLVFGPLFWRIEGKDGSLREYGRDYPELKTRSAVYANNGDITTDETKPSPMSKIPTLNETGGRRHIATWAIGQSSDRLGNSVRYRYESFFDGAPANDPFERHYLSHVFYTKNGANYENAALVFDYVGGDSQFGWSAGSVSRADKRLVRVRSCLRDSPNVAITPVELTPTGLCTSAERTLRVYNFGYEVQSNVADVYSGGRLTDAGRYGSGRARMATMQICTDAGSATCWPATQLTWSAARAGYQPLVETATPISNPVPTIQTPFYKAAAVRLTDLNRDGLPDAVWRQKLVDGSPDKIWVSIQRPDAPNPTRFGVNTHNHKHVATIRDQIDNSLYGADADRKWGLADVNGDGLEDLIFSDYMPGNTLAFGHYVKYANPDGTGYAAEETCTSSCRELLGGSANQNLSEPGTQFQLADTSGDGIVDLLVPVVRQNPTRTVLATAVGAIDVNGTLSWGEPTELQLSFNGTPANTCYKVGFGEKYRPDDFESQDINGDAQSDLILRVQPLTGCTGYGFGLGLEPPPITNGFPEVMWGIFASAGANTFNSVALFRTIDERGTLRLSDINGDGALDIVARMKIVREVDGEGEGESEPEYGNRWTYMLNHGNGQFEREGACLIPAMINGFPSCENSYSPNVVNMMDYNGDGKLDVAVGVDSLQTEPPFGDATRVRVHFWSDQQIGGANCTGPVNCSHFSMTPVWTNLVRDRQATWRTLDADLDGDATADNLAYDTDPTSLPGDGAPRVYSRQIDRYKPRDVVTAVTSGFGATTSFVYQPMSFATVYTRDYNAARIRTWGRGNTIVDATSMGYLVTAMNTPAPTTEDPNQLASTSYRYMGMKIQGGGRGALGFRKIYSRNAQNSVETVTEYAQQFPLTGRPISTESRALNAAGDALWGNSSCTPDTSDANACFRPQPNCTDGACAHFSGNDATPSNRGQILQRSVDLHYWRTRSLPATNFGATINPVLPPAPISIFVFTRSSTSYRYESDPDLENVVIASTVNDFFATVGGVEKSFDAYGNLLASSTRQYAGVPGGSAQYEIKTNNDFSNTSWTWTLGRLMSSEVTHSRPGDTKVRLTEFAYDVNGQLRMERVQPGDPALQLTKYTLRDGFGQPTISLSCSKAIEDSSNCRSDYRPPNHLPSNQVFRYSRVVNDPITGLAVENYGLANSNGMAVERLVSSTTLNKWGGPLTITTTDAPTVTNTYDLMGRVVHSYSSTGAQSTTLMRYCSGGISCPANAVTRVETKSPHAPSSWSYSDKLGRGIVSLSEEFKKGSYSLVRTGFDHLGRQIWQSEPVSTTVGPANASALLSVALVRTETCYDIGGRVIYLKLPNHEGAFSCSSPLSALEITNATPDDKNVIQTIYRGLSTVTINGLGQWQTVIANAMGETETSEDAAGYKTAFVYDALGNLKSVTRGAGLPETTTTSMSYDIMGRRVLLDDPDTGLRKSYYNALGESIREVDAKSQCTQNDLDFNGRVIRTTEYPSWNVDNTQCAGTAGKRTFASYDAQQLGKLDATSYGNTDTPTEAGSVRSRIAYDAFGRVVSTERCIKAMAIGQGVVTDCKIEQQAFDQFGRPYWAADASSTDLVHGSDPYAGAGVRRGVRMHYSTATTLVDNVAVNAHFMTAQTKLGSDTQFYYEVLQTNARGQITKERIAGKTQFTTSRSYEASTGRLLGLETGSLQMLSVLYDELGNLLLRSDYSNGRAVVESSMGEGDYDVLNRVTKTSLTVGGQPQGTLQMSYSADGNITSKVGTLGYQAAHVGGYEYGAVANVHGANCSAGSKHAVGAVSTIGYCYDANGNQTRSMDRSSLQPKRVIHYAQFDKPIQLDSYEVSAPGHSTRYGYGPAREMAWRLDIPQYAGQINDAVVEVHYFGSVERELRREGSGVRETYKRMIGGVLQVVEERVISAGNTSGAMTTLREEVLLKDHLGSTHVIVNSDGSNAQYQRFDVWGMRADAQSGSTQTLQQSYQTNNPTDASKTRTRKGFTGHEMVDGAGIVHMQGRIYDPLLGRFLQADPIVQDPLNAQSYNRYTYVFNNPLSLTDPSGYRSLSANLELYWKPVATIVVAVVTWNAAAAAKGVAAFAWAAAGGATIGLINTGTLRGTLLGAFQGFATFGIGKIGNFYANLGAHMMLGGLLEELNGGDFGHGMLSAGLSKAIGIGIDGLEGVSDPVKIVLQGIAGGAIAEAEGSGFANGAASFALQFALNQALGGARRYRAPTLRDIYNQAEAQQLIRQIREIAPGREVPVFVGPPGSSHNEVSIRILRNELAAARTDMAYRTSLPVGRKIAQSQGTHQQGSPSYGGQSYMNRGLDTLQVLQAYHSGAGQVLGIAPRSNNQVLFYYPAVTGTYYNPGFNGLPPISRQSSVFMLKGSRTVEVVPVNPAKGP